MCPAGLVSQCGSKLGQSVRRSQVAVDRLLQSVTVLVVVVVAPLGAFVDGECIGGLADLSLQDLVVGSLIGISRLIGDGFQRGQALIKCQIIGKVLVGVEPLQELKSQILVLYALVGTARPAPPRIAEPPAEPTGEGMTPNLKLVISCTKGL